MHSPTIKTFGSPSASYTDALFNNKSALHPDGSGERSIRSIAINCPKFRLAWVTISWWTDVNAIRHATSTIIRNLDAGIGKSESAVLVFSICVVEENLCRLAYCPSSLKRIIPPLG
jgi:hypothetical protein